MFKIVARVAYTALVLIEASIIVRMAVLILNANQSNSIIWWIMNITSKLIAPFNGVISTEYIIIGNMNIEILSIVALFFYMILAFITIEILRAFSTD